MNQLYEIQESRDSPLLSNKQDILPLFSSQPTSLEIVMGRPSIPGYKEFFLSIPSPFTLSCLSSLKHLKLELTVEIDVHGLRARGQSNPFWWPSGHYSVPFGWLQMVLDDLSGIRRAPLCDPCIAPATLELLTLALSFDLMLDMLSEVSWVPLATALSSFSSVMPSLKKIVIEIGRRPDKRAAHHLRHRPESEKEKDMIVEVLEQDEHLRTLIERGLLCIVRHAPKD